MKARDTFDYLFFVIFTLIFGYDCWKAYSGIPIETKTAIGYGALCYGYVILHTIDMYLKGKAENDVSTDSEKSDAQ